ncbi:MAG: nucleotide exchange factor GrpE [Candidatus Hydrogenedentota bacterium]
MSDKYAENEQPKAPDEPGPPAPDAAETAETAPEGHPADPERSAGEDVETAPDMVQDMAAITAERDEYREMAQRARAEFDNYRKRMAREMDRVRKSAAEELIRDLLPVVDNLDRALSHVENREDSFVQGVEMVVKQFVEVLTARGLEPIPAMGEPFDPNVHDALTQQPSEEYPAGTVMQEWERGYKLGNFVLRPAKVVVSSGPPKNESEPETPEGETKKA